MSLKINPCPCALQHRKQLFTLKEGRRDGQILQLHCPKPPKERNVCGRPEIRFTNVAFNKTGQILVTATSNGDIYNFNFTQCRFSHLTNTNSCTFLKFNLLNDEEVFIGKNNGIINIINVENGEMINNLKGHKHPVKDVSFAKDYLCVSSSVSEAIVWDLRNFTKLQALCISNNTVLKQVMFMPISDNVLTCFNDDSIHIWKYGTFNHLKQIQPALWNKFIIKCMGFTRNGRIIILAGYSQHLAVFRTDTWDLQKTIILPNQITSVKKLDFISQPFDGGANRILSILASNGTIYFYDMLRDTILNQLAFDVEIIRYDSSYDGRFIACVTSDGKAYVYLLASYVLTDEDCRKKIVKAKQGKDLTRSLCALYSAKEKIDDMLDIKKLLSILKEYGKYPEMHRFKIWIQLLQLPYNIKQYQALNSKCSETHFENLEKKYPIENRILMKNLKKLLLGLNLWCSFFSEVTYLPLFIFPFVKVFQNDPLICFEAVITIIINYCQYWFEYYPLPPVNVLAMIENVFLHHDPTLMQHLTSSEITSKIYAWSLMQTSFSEILSSNDWLILWDHILSNEPSFLIMVTVAYNLINKPQLMQLTNMDDFKAFYCKQNCVDVKRLISKSYQLLESTEDVFHPRRYLENFKKLDEEVYPTFNAYPKAVLDYQANIKEIKNCKKVSCVEEKEILERSGLEYNKLEEAKRQIEEYIRKKEVDRLYQKKLEEDRAEIERQASKLSDLKTFLESELSVECDCSSSLITSKPETERTFFSDAKTIRCKYLCFYRKILETDCAVEAFCKENYHKVSLPDNCKQKIDGKILEAISKGRKVENSEQYLAQLAVTTGLIVLEKIITKFNEKIKECSYENKSLNKKFVIFMIEQIERTERQVETVLQSLSNSDDIDKDKLDRLKGEFNQFQRKSDFSRLGTSPV